MLIKNRNLQHFWGLIPISLSIRQYFRGEAALFILRTMQYFQGVDAPYTKQCATFPGIDTHYTKQYEVLSTGQYFLKYAIRSIFGVWILIILNNM